MPQNYFKTVLMNKSDNFVALPNLIALIREKWAEKLNLKAMTNRIKILKSDRLTFLILEDDASFYPYCL